VEAITAPERKAAKLELVRVDADAGASPPGQAKPMGISTVSMICKG
jgi:hypothetical protein